MLKPIFFYALRNVFRAEKYRDGVSALLNFIYLCILFKTKMRY